MIPGGRFAVAHGQMDEGDLESTMLTFSNNEADILVCTTIIESGLDIPRVNTILVEDAHRFGLSQLYQLRGRVGRAGIQAHAWLFYPKQRELTDAARQRLRAIQEFTQLGSGYQLAMRDMEIRGVGNLLGAEQSGQMEAMAKRPRKARSVLIYIWKCWRKPFGKSVGRKFPRWRIPKLI